MEKDMEKKESHHVRVSRSVVSIGILKDKTIEYVDGIVVAKSDEYISVMAHPANLAANMRKELKIFVRLPNGIDIPLDRDKCTSSGGIYWIKCLNPTPGSDCGFGKLEAIKISQQDAEEHDKVYAYTHHHLCKLLTPGRVLLVEDTTFDHNCGAHETIESGAPVINESGDLVGMCDFYRDGYFTAHKASEIRRVRSQIVSDGKYNF